MNKKRSNLPYKRVPLDSMKEKLSNECDRYFRSEKGEIFLSENQDFVMYHRKQYGVTFQEFCEHRILCGRKRKFYDTIFNVLSQKASEYQMKGFISQLEWIYHNLSDSLYDEKFDGIEVAKNRIDSESTFNPHIIARIFELQPYFKEQMLDVVYTPEILSYCLFGKYDMLDTILDLYEEKFDAEFYTKYIKINYEKYVKHFI